MDSIINFTDYSISAAAATWKGRCDAQKDTVWFSNAEQAATAGSFMAVLSDGMENGQEVSTLIVSSYANSHVTRGNDSLACFLNTANEALKEATVEGAISNSAGATLIAAKITENGIEWQSMGNALLYLQRDGVVKKINTAYTLEEKLAGEGESGKITNEEAPPLSEATDVCRPGDRYIMVSDGFAPLTETAWEELLNSAGIRQASPAETCEMLLMKLNKMNKEEQDNASIIIFDVVEKQEKTASESTPTEISEKVTENNSEEKAIEVQLIGDRSSQQDSVGHWHSDKATLAVVADGAGGHVGGAQASQTAVATIERYWQDKLYAGVSADEAAKILTQAVQQAHTDIIQNAGGNAALSGKSAFVAVYLHDGQYTCINVGDCRAYVTYQGQWKQLSIDDSLLRILVDKGEVSPQEAKNHPDQNILTQALGTENKIKPHISHGTFSEQDSFLLCCDGLWNQLPDEQWPLANWEANNTAQYKNVLMIMANKAAIAANGSSDNISAVWICATAPNKAAFRPPVVPQQTTPTNILQSPVAKMVLTAIGLLLITTVLLILYSSPDQPTTSNPQAVKESHSGTGPIKSQSPLNNEGSAATTPKVDTKLSTPVPTCENEPSRTTTMVDGPQTPRPEPAYGNEPYGTTTMEEDTLPPCPEPTYENELYGTTPLEEDAYYTPAIPNQSDTDNRGEDKVDVIPGQEKTNHTNDCGYTATISSVRYISGNRYVTHVSYQCGNVSSFHAIRRRTQRQLESPNAPALNQSTSTEVILDQLFRQLLPFK